jgi:conjugal transfer pilus assembly protein TraV
MIPMSPSKRLLLCAAAASALSACTTFGTNVSGDFTCRAPQGDCAPSHVIDARATAELGEGASPHQLARVRAGVAAGDTGRTLERTLRIVFPAHVDEAGTLHDEAVAWTVVENPRWAAELRRKPGEDSAPRLIRQLSRQLKDAQARPAMTDADAADASGEPDLGSPFSLASPPLRDSPVASPLVLPSTAREAVAGAKAPAVEGFDMSPPPHDRTPRPSADETPRTYPAIETIEAAKAAASAKHPTAPAKEPK